MKNIVMLFCWFIPVLATAQNKEIEFRRFKNWQQVLEKAKEEDKKIFVDVYATWCGPCKKMDADVYTNAKVAEFVNENFIAVKVQMDQVKNDPDPIRNWYSEANELRKKYKIEAMPTFLFVDSGGNLVYKNQGYQDSEMFLLTIKAANDPIENYPNKIAQYKVGKVYGENLRVLALQAKKYHDDSLAVQIAKTYKKSVIDHSEPSKILSPGLLNFLRIFGDLLQVDNPIARYLYDYSSNADSLLGDKGYSKQMTNYLIAKDILNPILVKNGKIIVDKPDWDFLQSQVADSYDVKTAEKILIGYKAEWYRSKQDWQNYVKAAIERQELIGIDTSGMGKSNLNNLVYYIILKYSDDPVYLNKGLDFMKVALKGRENDDARLDTYANVLYKLGRKTEALETEEKALTLARQRNDVKNIKFYEETIQKMKSDLPVPIINE
jgi:thioredoxin-related protein